MKRLLIVLVSCVSVVFATYRVAEGLGFNTSMLYRYPWLAGVSMTRTQGWGAANPSHTGDLYYAVDWDNGSGNWLAHAANGGTLRCERAGDGVQESFGNYLVIYNSVANQTAMYAHLQNCGFFVEGVLYDATQGQGLAPVDCTGTCTGTHLHFHVVSGDVYTGQHVTVSFSMSDKNSFSGSGGSDGPSDNIWVGDNGAGGTDAITRAAYLAIGGGASAAWWNIGSTWGNGGGPCIYTSTQFVHTCSTQHGAFTVQNYIRYDGQPSGIAKNSAGTSGYRIAAPIWRVMGTQFRTDILTNQLGPPAGAEFTSGTKRVQNFAGGQVQRFTDRPRQDVLLAGVWRATYWFQTLAGECYDTAEDNLSVGLADALIVNAHFGESEQAPPFDPRYDVNRTGSTGLADTNLVLAQFGLACVI